MSLEPIAIVGTGCRFPGSSSSPDRLWHLLQNPGNVVSKVPSGRFNVDAFYHPNSQQHGSTSVAESYFLEEDIRAFDASFFSISPAEAAAMDPQQRLLLETVYDSLEAGGHRLDVLQGSATGVYCGFLRTDYSQIQFADPDSFPPYTVTGNSPAIMANRISYFFNWTGPSFSVDTGCSSSLLAVHLAVESLRKGDCNLAVAVGSNLILSPNPYIADAKTGMLSATGRSRMWDASADGYARGEGVASVVLKRLSDAVAAGDEIECVIRATGVNSDGRTMGITMPNGEAQRKLIESTYASIGLDPKNAQHRCQYFEAHGTGTQAGDPQEASAIHAAFFGHDAKNDSGGVLHVGSIKTVIGHTEATAGLAGLIKASLCLQHGEITPNLLFSRPNPRITPYLTRLQVPTESVAWPALPPGVPRRASVNSFGFGGANVHAILESYDPPSPSRRCSEGAAADALLLPFVVSAASELSLETGLQGLLQFLGHRPETNLMDLAQTLLTRRSCHKYRIVFIARSLDELRDKILHEISCTSSGQISAKIHRPVQPNRNSGILGIFTGQGAQWPQMGLDIIKSSTQAQIWMADMQKALDSLPQQYRPDFDLMTELAVPESDSRIHEVRISQVLRTAVQIVQTNLLRTLGVNFHTVIGHSSGEIAAAFAAGVLDLPDTIRIAYLRGWAIKQSQTQQQTPGSMIAVMLDWKQADAICCNLAQYKGKIQIAAYNSPRSVTLSGDRDAIEELAWLLSSLGHAVHRLHVDTAYHSHHMLPAAKMYREALKACNIQAKKPSSTVRWFSAVHPGVDLSATQTSQAREYWVANMLESVSFSQAVATALQSSPETKYGCAIEIGPHPVLGGPVNQILEGMSKPIDLPYLGLARRATSGIQSFAAAIGELWTIFGPGGVDVQGYLSAFDYNASAFLVKDLPRYPFDHSQTYWAESRLSRARLHARNPPNALLGRMLPTSGQGERRWRNYLRPEELAWLDGYRLEGKPVLPPATYISMMSEAALEIAGVSLVQLLELRELEFYQDVPLPSDQAGLEILFAVELDSDNPHALGRFTCQAAIDGELCRAASGRFKITYDVPDFQALAARVTPLTLNPVDVNEFYLHLSALGHERGGEFKRLSTLACNRKAASATIAHRDSNSHQPLNFHPATIDHAFQTLLATSISRTIDQATGSRYTVSRISYVGINPNLCSADSEALTIDGSIVTKSPGLITGAVDIFQSNDECVLSCEGIDIHRTSNKSNAPHLFSNINWIPLQPSTTAGGNVLCRPGAVSTLMAREQLALLHLRHLCRKYARKAREILPEDKTTFLNWAEYVLTHVREGMHPVCRPEWLASKSEDICTPPLEPLARIGEDWGNLLSSECEDGAPAVELLDQYYTANMQDFKPWFDRLVSLVRHLTALYPEMDIVELTLSSSDRLTRHVLSEIGTAYKTYTRAVVSRSTAASSTMPAAQPSIRERFFEEDAFQPGSVNLVIVHQALYSIKSLDDALKTLRRMIKPGGYLLVLEDTNPNLIHRKLLLPLSGWKNSDAENLSNGPIWTREAWKSLLIKHGFSGIDSITPIHDEVISGLSIIVSRAVESAPQLIQSPFDTSNKHTNLVIVAAENKWMDRTWVAVSESFRRMELVENIREIEFGTGNPPPVVLVVTNSLKPTAFSGPVEEEKQLRRLFNGASKLLWVTSRSDSGSPVALSNAVTAGFLCNLSIEYPDTMFQRLELPCGLPSEKNVDTVVTLLMRLVFTTARDSPWIESHLRLSEKGVLHVPRHTYCHNMNQRCLAAHVEVEDNVSLNRDREYPVLQVEHVKTTEKQVARLHAYQSIGLLSDVPTTGLEVDVRYSTAHSIKIEGAGSFYLSLGTVSGHNNGRYQRTENSHSCRVFALSERNASRVHIPFSRCWDVPPAISAAQEAGFLANIVAILIAKDILSQTQPGSAILLLEPDVTIFNILNSLGSLHKINIITVTHKAAAKANKKGLIYIPERTPSHRLRQMLPMNKVVRAVVFDRKNGEGGPNARIRSLFPNARQLDIGSFYQNATTANSQRHVPILSIPAAIQSVAGWLHPEDSTVAVSPITKLLSEEIDLGPTSVIKWSSETQTPIRAQIHPATDAVKLSQQGAYVLWDLPESLRRAVAEWLLSHGAQHLVLVQKIPDDAQWVSSITCGGGEVVIVPPKEDLVHTVLALRDHPSVPLVRGIVFTGALDNSVAADTIKRAEFLSQHYDSPDLKMFLGIDCCPAIPNSQQCAVTEFLAALAHQRATTGLASSVLRLGPGFDLHTPDGDEIAEILAEAVLAGHPSASGDRVVTAGLCPDSRSPVYKAWDAIHSRNPAMSNILALSRKGRQENTAAVEVAAEHVPLNIQLELAKETASAASAVRGILNQHFTRYLQVRLQSTAEITEDTLFNELGVDSMVAAQLAGWFHKEVGVEVSVVSILAGACVGEVLQEVTEKLIS
ncbi:Non-reducing polyketide synthase pyr2 [Penicillium rolfsii]|nr:Non-reducing polyketide synthase pyr2 [Penicillium rolfsii]